MRGSDCHQKHAADPKSLPPFALPYIARVRRVDYADVASAIAAANDPASLTMASRLHDSYYALRGEDLTARERIAILLAALRTQESLD